MKGDSAKRVTLYDRHRRRRHCRHGQDSPTPSMGARPRRDSGQGRKVYMFRLRCNRSKTYVIREVDAVDPDERRRDETSATYEQRHARQHPPVADAKVWRVRLVSCREQEHAAQCKGRAGDNSAFEVSERSL